MRVAVEVWRIDLATAPPMSAADLEELSVDERARHARYLVAEPARVFATTRIALRRLLGQRLGRPAAAVQIEAGVRGKPALVGASQPFFNVSHGPGSALIALCEVAQVGIDVEGRTALAFDSPVAASICTATEMAWIRLNRASADITIARLWNRKEAVLKAAGLGLGQPMSELDLGVPDATAGICEASDLDRIAWKDLALPHTEVGAVAVLSDDASAITVAVRPYLSRHDR